MLPHASCILIQACVASPAFPATQNPNLVSAGWAAAHGVKHEDISDKAELIRKSNQSKAMQQM